MVVKKRDLDDRGFCFEALLQSGAR